MRRCPETKNPTCSIAKYGNQPGSLPKQGYPNIVILIIGTPKRVPLIMGNPNLDIPNPGTGLTHAAAPLALRQFRPKLCSARSDPEQLHMALGLRVGHGYIGIDYPKKSRINMANNIKIKSKLGEQFPKVNLGRTLELPNPPNPPTPLPRSTCTPA